MVSTISTDQSKPIILSGLPDIPIATEGCPRRTRMQIDLILLALEALNLKGSEDILALSRQLELQGIIKNRVLLWQMRSTNPWRRFSQRRPLTQAEAKALVTIACQLARRWTVPIRQLLQEYDKLQQTQSEIAQNPHLAYYLERFRKHFRSRMNPRRSGVIAYSTDEKLNELGMKLLAQLLFCTGTSGAQRLWVSLFDGEV
ncbi:MAG: DUF3038 domain-containing protein [Geitlerinemataceae cyanobacterium]